MQQGRAISWFLFLLVFVLSLIFSVMSLILSWNSLTERSEGEVFHGFYFFLSLSCLWSCLWIAQMNKARDSYFMVSIYSCLWSCLWFCHEIAWLSAVSERYFMVLSLFLSLVLSLVLSCLCPVLRPKAQRIDQFYLVSTILYLMWLVLNR